LPSYTEEVIGIEMDPPLRGVYTKLEEQVKNALREPAIQTLGKGF
jgi:hypothetical protein